MRSKDSARSRKHYLWLNSLLLFTSHNSIAYIRYQASTRLRYQSFDNCLRDEPWVVTPIRQSLVSNYPKLCYVSFECSLSWKLSEIVPFSVRRACGQAQRHCGGKKILRVPEQVRRFRQSERGQSRRLPGRGNRHVWWRDVNIRSDSSFRFHVFSGFLHKVKFRYLWPSYSAITDLSY